MIYLGNNSLPDGVYDLTFLGAGFTQSFSSTNGSSVKFSFHRLFGDIDGDRDVDGQDLAAFRPQMNTTWTGFVAASDAFDGDQDNAVTRTDYDLARANSGKVLTYSSADFVPEPVVATETANPQSTETLVTVTVPTPPQVDFAGDSVDQVPPAPAEDAVPPQAESDGISPPIAAAAPPVVAAPLVDAEPPVMNIIAAPAPVATESPTLVAAVTSNLNGTSAKPASAKTTGPKVIKLPAVKLGASKTPTKAPQKEPSKPKDAPLKSTLAKPNTTTLKQTPTSLGKSQASRGSAKVKPLAPAKNVAKRKITVATARRGSTVRNPAFAPMAFSSTPIGSGAGITSQILQARVERSVLTDAD